MSVQTAMRRFTGRAERQPAPAQSRYLWRARLRLALWSAGVVTLLLVAVGIAAYVALARVLSDEVVSELKSAAVAFQQQNPVSTLGPPLRLPGASADSADAFPDVYAYFIGISNSSVFNPRNVSIIGFPDGPSVVAASAGRTDLRTVTKGGITYRLLSEPIEQPAPDGHRQIVGVLQVVKSLHQYQQDLRDIAFVLGGGAGAAVLLTAIGALLLSARALQPVQQSWQRQQSFVADASHELRTPLAIMRADAEVLLRAPARSVEENRDLVEDIISEADRLNILVSDMLLLVRLDTGRLPLQRVEFDARAMIDDVAAQSRRLYDDKGITVVSGGAAELPVVADHEQLLQVLRILVDNAQHHMPDGGRIQLWCRGDGSQVSLEVADTGVGISAEDLPHVFDRFYRADRARTRGRGGAGLGLAIARGIVEAHGGRLRVQSEPGKGTTATIELPVQRPSIWAGGAGSRE